MENKRLFQVLDDMNVADGENNTEHVAVSNAFVSVNKVKAGSHITMGATEQALWDIESGKKIPILLLIDSEEYFKRKNR